MKRIAQHPWPALWAFFLMAPAAIPAAETAGAPEAEIAGACDSIAAARAQLAAVLKLLEEKNSTDLGGLRDELDLIRQQALARDAALDKAELRLDACAETETELRAQIAILSTQRDELARTVARLQAAEAAAAGPAPAEPDAAADRVLAAARRWAAAWAAQDLDAYLGCYDEAFQPPAGLSRQDWETQRRDRLGRPGRIRIELTEARVQIDSADTATLDFTQHYHSDRYSDTTRKRLRFRNRDGAWRIVEEHAEAVR